LQSVVAAADVHLTIILTHTQLVDMVAVVLVLLVGVSNLVITHLQVEVVLTPVAVEVVAQDILNMVVLVDQE